MMASFKMLLKTVMGLVRQRACVSVLVINL